MIFENSVILPISAEYAQIAQKNNLAFVDVLCITVKLVLQTSKLRTSVYDVHVKLSILHITFICVTSIPYTVATLMDTDGLAVFPRLETKFPEVCSISGNFKNTSHMLDIIIFFTRLETNVKQRSTRHVERAT